MGQKPILMRSIYHNTSQADIFVGGKGSGTDHINFIADQTLEHIRTAITRLAKLGAKQFMFWNTSDIAPLQPGFVINDYVADRRYIKIE